MMRSLLLLLVVVLLAAVPLEIHALSNGAAGCMGGTNAAAAGGQHTDAGSLSDGGYTVTVEPADSSVVTVTITATAAPIKGFLIRMDDGLLEDFVEETTQSASLCAAPTVGATHTSSQDKMSVAATFSSSTATAVDVTVVESFGVTYYSSVDVQAPVAVATEAPTMAATTMAPTEVPTETATTLAPTEVPTETATTMAPTEVPTETAITLAPTEVATDDATLAPTEVPTTLSPTDMDTPILEEGTDEPSTEEPPATEEPATEEPDDDDMMVALPPMMDVNNMTNVTMDANMTVVNMTDMNMTDVVNMTDTVNMTDANMTDVVVVNETMAPIVMPVATDAPEATEAPPVAAPVAEADVTDTSQGWMMIAATGVASSSLWLLLLLL